MKFYTGAEYLMIDLANSYGMDKELFPARISWVRSEVIPHINDTTKMDDLAANSDEPILFIKILHTIREVMLGKPTGHLVELDATTSGVQVLSALTCCLKGGVITNLLDPSKRYDAYTYVYVEMCKRLGVTDSITRKEIKEATMTSLYGSKATPKEIFGADTKELACFYEVLEDLLPGAWEAGQDLVELWQSDVLAHDWPLPDGYMAHVPVIDATREQIEVDELDHHTFTHMFYENKTKDKYISLQANVTHSIDAYIVREMNRRCNHNPDELKSSAKRLADELIDRGIYGTKIALDLDTMISLVNHANDPKDMDDSTLVRMAELIAKVLNHKTLELICIHDAFKSLAGHMNTVRYWYKELLAELAESNLLGDIFSYIEGSKVHYDKLSDPTEYARLIRESEYCLS